ncbi:hypothetical protein [Embleya sp. NBC_00896]|uniref:hypothetical protein n=1 Tax=Embleya sp. NBC_00896 TaxID=2975961 RepID=UPI0038677A86|nr:hypothetical protein OG928_04695 [Embleya sp. NBC_00896]
MTTPPPPAEPPRRRVAEPLWAATPGPTRERTTSRLRRVVEGLPDWEPLPPGELIVRRPSADR